MKHKEKLIRAKITLQFLQQGIAAMESNTGDPDYDLWRAWEELNLIKLSDEAEQEDEPVIHPIDNADLPDPKTGFSLFGDLR
jgi:hypothetical protein